MAELTVEKCVAETFSEYAWARDPDFVLWLKGQRAIWVTTAGEGRHIFDSGNSVLVHMHTGWLGAQEGHQKTAKQLVDAQAVLGSVQQRLRSWFKHHKDDVVNPLGRDELKKIIEALG